MKNKTLSSSRKAYVGCMKALMYLCAGLTGALVLFLVGYVLLTPIIWSSIRLKRHTALQLLAGCVIPVLAMLICRAQFL